TGDGVDRLADEIVRRLVPNIPPPLTPLPITSRQVELLSEVRRLLESSSSDNLWHERVEALITG
ncbi:MAG: hypothetical protein KF861_07825, partial [Planctomycetaceae bacterium]|nr:hypothetical protein [Planctomycetaceae bacterium]